MCTRVLVHAWVLMHTRVFVHSQPLCTHKSLCTCRSLCTCSSSCTCGSLCFHGPRACLAPRVQVGPCALTALVHAWVPVCTWALVYSRPSCTHGSSCIHGPCARPDPRAFTALARVWVLVYIWVLVHSRPSCTPGSSCTHKSLRTHGSSCTGGSSCIHDPRAHPSVLSCARGTCARTVLVLPWPSCAQGPCAYTALVHGRHMHTGPTDSPRAHVALVLPSRAPPAPLRRGGRLRCRAHVCAMGHTWVSTQEGAGTRAYSSTRISVHTHPCKDTRVGGESSPTLTCERAHALATRVHLHTGAHGGVGSCTRVGMLAPHKHTPTRVRTHTCMCKCAAA